MNVGNLRDTYPSLLAQMKTSGYSVDYISRIEKEIQWILKVAPSKDWKCYHDIYLYYESTLQNPKMLVKKHAMLGLLDHFDISGGFPDSKHRGFKKRGRYHKLIPEYRILVDYYRDAAKERNKSNACTRNEFHSAIGFLYDMQETGITRLEDITEEAVVSYYMHPGGLRYDSRVSRASLVEFFKVCAITKPYECSKIIPFIPIVRKSRKNIQYLTLVEVEKVRDALNDRSNKLSLCDRAIGKLALYTGLRSCDMAALEVSSIDWECDVIKVNQLKTEHPLEIPLTAVVGNAIDEYLSDERPVTLCPSLFVTSIGAYRPMTSGAMWRASERIMKAASIRQEKGDRKGWHIFRHHLATALLGNGVSHVAISRTLGHVSPSSTEAYFSSDFVNLKSCALDISPYVVAEGVFDIA